MKNFTKQNFKTNPLWIRLIIMAFMLLIGTGSAWAYNQSAKDLYFDNSEAKWNACYVYIGHSTWTSCYPMKRVDGTQYLWKLAKADFNGGGTWNSATGWVVSMEKWWDNNGESIDKYVWHGDKNVTKKSTSAWVDTKIYKTNGTTSVTSDGTTKTVYSLTSSDLKNYTVTIESVAGGTLTVKDYDNNAVTSGASKIHLTVLKFSATPLDGYSLQGVEINDGSSTTTISEADLASKTHTLTSAVTITPVWKENCTTCCTEYYVAGTTALTGQNPEWNASEDKMTCSSNKWSITFSNVAAGSHQFQIVSASGTWIKTIDTSKDELKCTTVQNGNYQNIGFTTSKKGHITIYYTESGGAYGEFEAACTTPDAPSIKINNESTVTLCEGSATITTTAVTGATSYSLYKGSATTASQTNTTGTFTVSEADTYYVTVTTCEESLKQTTGVTLSYYSAPTLTDKYSVTNATKCNNTPNNDGTISIQNGVDGVRYSLNDDEGTSWSGLAKGTYTLKATLDACNKLSDTKTVEVGETDKTPAINNISIKEVSAVCKGEDLTLQLNEAVQDDVTYTWYKSNTSSSSIGTGTSLALTNLQETSTYILVASKTENSCTATKEASIEVTVNAIPDAPDAITFDPVCGGVGFELPSISGNWYAAEEGGDPIEKNINGGITTQTTYYASAILKGCESTSRTPLTVSVKNKPAIPTLTAQDNVTEIIAGKTTTTLNVGNIEVDATYTLYKDGQSTPNTGNSFTISEGGKYKVVASNSNGCGTSESEEIEITICTPISNIRWRITSIAEDVYCSGEEVQVTLNYDGDTATGIEWNLNGVTVSNNENEIASGTVYTMIVNQSGSAQLTLIGCDGVPYPTTPMQFSVSSETVAPTIGISKNSICEGEGAQTITVNEYNPNYTYALYKDGVKQNTTISNTGTFTVNTTGEYTVTAKNCVESTPSNSVSLTVNPLPTITISGNKSAVFYEDVTLTATATAGATVKWYEGGEEKGEGLTYVVTSASDASKIVTAKAFLNGCESAVASHTVNFSAENCNPTPSKDLIIICDPNGEDDNIYCYAWDASDNKPLGNWPGTKGTKEDGKWRWEIKNTSATYTIIFNNNNNCQTNNIEDKLTGGWQYDYKLASSGWCNANRSYTSKTSLSVPAPKSTPTVKTVLAESNPGEGNLSFKGQVVKTGCYDQAKLAVQYRLKDSGNDYTTYYWNNSEALVDIEPGKEFEINLTDITPDGVYEVRARIYISSDVKSYGNVIEVPITTVKTPISNINLSYCNESGTAIADPNPMCKGTTAYIKLDYEGSRYSECKWLINGVATQKITKVSEKVWSFEIQQEEELVTVELRNDANKDGETPTWATSNKLSFTMVPEPISPTISLSPSVICSNNEDGATLNLAALVAGQSYELYKYADENDNTGAKVAGYNAIQCTDASENLSFTGLKEAGRYFVKAYNTTQCQSIMAGSAFSTLEVVDASDVFINFVPTSATTTPWMPAKFTVNASDKYTLTVPDGVVYNIDGNKVSVKIPLPAGSTGGDGQYENVSFPEGAKTSYTITANLATSGGVDNPCAAPASATITLTPYVEPCTEGH